MHVDPWFAELMVKLAEGWGTKLTEMRIRVYARGLADLPQEQLREACSRALRESAFFPTVAYLRQCAESTSEEAGLLAWATLRRAAQDVGAYASVTCADGAVAYALEVAFGSWAAFCGMEEGPQMHTRRQEFLAAYRVARYKYRQPRRLPGLCEARGPYVPEKSLSALLTADGDVRVVTDQVLAPLARLGDGIL